MVLFTIYSSRIARRLFTTLLLLSTGIIFSSALHAQMSAGTYYIDGSQSTSGNSFQTFADFFTALNTAGNAIASPGITLKVKPVTNGYNEQFTIPYISGLGASSRFVIRGDGSINTRIHHASSAATNSYSVVFIDSASYITLDSLYIENTDTTGYNYAVKLKNNCQYDAVSNCTLKARTNGYSNGYAYPIAFSDGSTAPAGGISNPQYCIVDHCQLLGGYYGAYLYGGASSTGPWPVGNEFTNNFIQGQYYYGAYFYYQNGIKISGNTYDGSQAGSTSHYGFMMYYINNAQVTNNVVNYPGAYAYYIYYWNFFNTSIVNGRALFANNSIHGNSTYVFGSGGYVYSCKGLDFVYNSILYSNSITSSSTSYGIRAYNSDDIKILNNAVKFSNGGTKYALYLQNLTNSTVDYNTIFDDLGGMIYFNSGLQYSSLSAFQTGTGYQTNGQEVDPNFIAIDDLHVNGATLFGKGTPVASINVDVDGTSRSVTATSPGIHEYTPFNYDIGVSEFIEPIAVCPDTNEIKVRVVNYGQQTVQNFWVFWNWTGNTGFGNDSLVFFFTPGLASGEDTILYLDDVIMTSGKPGYSFEAYTKLVNDTNPLNDTAHHHTETGMIGSYTIGGINPDYSTFSDAAADLQNFGLCSPVVFYARSGTYIDFIRLSEVPGSSSFNTITFTTDTNNVNPVVLQHSTSSVIPEGVISLSGTSYITIDGYEIENLATLNSRAVYVNGSSKHVTIHNCELIVPKATGSTVCPLYIDINQDSSEFINVLNNRMYGGYYGLYVNGNYSGLPNIKHVNIIGNTIEDAYIYGIYLRAKNDALIVGNMMDVRGSGASSASFGMYISGTASLGIDIRNNRCFGNRYGLYVIGFSGTVNKHGTIVNNKIVGGQASMNVDGYNGLYLYNAGFLDISHNLIMLQGTSSSPGYAAYLYGGGNELYNNIFSTIGSAPVVYVNGPTTVTNMDFNCYNSPTGTFGLSYAQSLGFALNSIEVDFLYSNPDSLYTCNDSLVEAGIPLSYVNFDIDGGNRSNTAPTIGPHEFISPDKFNLGPDTSMCSGDTLYLGSYIVGATYTWNTNDTSAVIRASLPGSYMCAINTGCGSATDTVVVFSANTVSNYQETLSFMTVSFTNTSVNANSYLWTFGDGDSSLLMNPTHVYQAKGIYNVCLTAFGYCDTVTHCESINIGGVGLNESFNGNAFALYPNPAKDIIYIEFLDQESDALMIEITNATGQKVLRKTLNYTSGNIESLDVSKLKDGLYFVQLSTNEGVLIKRLLIQR